MSATNLIRWATVASSARNDPILVLRGKLQRIALIDGCFGRGPFPNVTHQILNTPTIGAGRISSDGLFSSDAGIKRRGMARRPGVAPRIQIVLIAVARRVLPFFFSGQPVSDAIALRSPGGKSDRIFVRNIRHGKQLLARLWFHAAPLFRRRVVRLLHKLRVLSVRDLGLVH